MTERPEDDGRPTVPAKWRPTPAEPVPVVRCTAIKKNGERCARWSLRGATVCVSHGGRLPNIVDHANAVVEGARMRLIGLSDMAIDVLEDLAYNSNNEKIRLDAAKDILDRNGVKGAIEINMDVQHTESAADRMKHRLEQIAARLETKNETDSAEEDGEVVDAEIVDDESDPGQHDS